MCNRVILLSPVGARCSRASPTPPAIKLMASDYMRASGRPTPQDARKLTRVRLRHCSPVVGPTDTAAGPPVEAVDSPEAGRMFLRGGAMRVVAYGGAIALSIGVIPLVSRHVHSSGYGQLATVA